MKLKTKFFLNIGGLVFFLFVFFGILIFVVTATMIRSNRDKEIENIANVTYYVVKNYFQIYQERAVKNTRYADQMISSDLSLNTNRMLEMVITNQMSLEGRYNLMNEDDHHGSDKKLEIKTIQIPSMLYQGELVYSNTYLVDSTSQKLGGAIVSIYQMSKDGLIRVSTTQRWGMKKKRMHQYYVPTDNPLYQSISNGRQHIHYELIDPGYMGEMVYINSTLPVFNEEYEPIGAIQSSETMVDRSELGDQITSIKVGNNGFPFIINGSGKIIAHPFFKGADIYDFKDKSGKYFIREICSNKNGWIDFYWKNPGDENFKKMIAKYIYVKEIDWIVIAAYYVEEYHQALIRIGMTVLSGFFVLFLVIVFVVNKLVRRTMIDPVSKLMKGLDKIKTFLRDNGAECDLSNLNFHIYSKDEIQELSRTMESMAQKLQDAFDDNQQKTLEIKKYSENLESMVSERTRELNISNKKLIETNEVMKKELDMAQKIQEAVIPKIFPDVRRIDLFGEYQPMEHLGGDFYDVYKITENRIGIVVSDVSGHGIPASLITMMAKVSFSNNSKLLNDPGKILQKVNDELCNVISDIDNYLTAFFCIIDLEEGVLEYCSAGHTDIVVINGYDGSLRMMPSTTMFIGAIQDLDFPVKKISIHRDDKLVLYTDGITEARNGDLEFFGEERFYEILRREHHSKAQIIVERVMDSLNQFKGSRPADDDITLLVIEMMDGFGIRSFDLSIAVGDGLVKDGGVDNRYTELNSKLMEAFDLFDQSDYEGAKRVILNDIYGNFRRSEDNFKVLNLLGHSYYRLRDLQNAKKYWHEAMKLNPYNNNLKHNLEILMEEEKFQL